MNNITELLPVSDDDRRMLFEYGNGTNWKVSKILIAKKDCVVGKHYHKKKTEMFFLIKGKISYCMIGDKVTTNIIPYTKILINKNIYHEFHLTKGSILIGLCDKFFDPKDELK